MCGYLHAYENWYVLIVHICIYIYVSCTDECSHIHIFIQTYIYIFIYVSHVIWWHDAMTVNMTWRYIRGTAYAWHLMHDLRQVSCISTICKHLLIYKHLPVQLYHHPAICKHWSLPIHHPSRLQSTYTDKTATKCEGHLATWRRTHLARLAHKATWPAWRIAHLAWLWHPPGKRPTWRPPGRGPTWRPPGADPTWRTWRRAHLAASTEVQ